VLAIVEPVLLFCNFIQSGVDDAFVNFSHGI
jgi:hypothetical protein